MVLQGGPCGRVGHRRTIFGGPLVPATCWDQRSFLFFRCAQGTRLRENDLRYLRQESPCPPTLPTSDRSAISAAGTVVTAAAPAGGRDATTTVVAAGGAMTAVTTVVVAATAIAAGSGEMTTVVGLGVRATGRPTAVTTVVAVTG